MQKTVFALTSAFMIALAACSSGPSADTKTAEKKPDPVTGQTALWKMYQVARSWAPDVSILKLNTIHLTEVPSVPGKAGAWEAMFASESKGRSKSYTYSVIEGEGTLHLGVFGGPEQPWSPSGNAQTQPFLISAVKIDTEAALNMALANGGTDYQKGKPKQTISFLLEKLPKFANPSWRVIWGESAGTSAYSIYVDAFANAFLERMH